MLFNKHEMLLVLLINALNYMVLGTVPNCNSARRNNIENL